MCAGGTSVQGAVRCRRLLEIGMQMNGQPHGAVGGALHRMRDACRQEQIVAGRECHRLSADLQDSFAFEEYDPFIMRLNVLTGCDGRRTDDALNDKVPVAEERIEALSLMRGLCIGKEILNLHASTLLA
jgi:hypothetical protein